MYLTTLQCIINPAGMNDCPRQLLPLYNSFPKVMEETDTYGHRWSNSRCTQTNTESFSISHLLLCKKHLNYLVHLGLEQALGRFWHSSRNQSGEKAKRKILFKTPQSLKLQLSASVQEHYEHFPSVFLPFQLHQQQWHWQVRVSQAAAGASGTLSHTLSRHRADLSSALAHSSAAANITSAPPLLAVLGAVYVLYKWSLEHLTWSATYLSSSPAAMEFQLFLTPIKIKSLSNKGFFQETF